MIHFFLVSLRIKFIKPQKQVHLRADRGHHLRFPEITKKSCRLIMKRQGGKQCLESSFQAKQKQGKVRIRISKNNNQEKQLFSSPPHFHILATFQPTQEKAFTVGLASTSLPLRALTAPTCTRRKRKGKREREKKVENNDQSETL